MREVNASIIHGSGVGPVLYVVNAADLHTVTPGNSLVKYADDTHLACNVDTRDIEIANVDTWSQANNLKLNRAKCAEIVFRDNQKRRCIQQPPPLQEVVRVTGRLHGPIVGPTGRSDPGYVRLSVRPVGQTGWTDCSRTAHIMSIKSMWPVSWL